MAATTLSFNCASEQPGNDYHRLSWLTDAGLPPPQKRVPLPRQITFQRKRANRQVVNEEQLLALLGEFGEVRRPISAESTL